jgi:HlyD family secretion protein
VVIDTSVLPEALLVPEAAVLRRRGRSGTVWVLRDGKLAQATVTLGEPMLDGRSQVLGGLPDGARVLAAISAEAWVGRPAREAGR